MTSSEVSGALPDPVSRLINLLAEERKNFTSVEIAETLWLAMQIEPAAEFVPDVRGKDIVVFALVLLVQSGSSPIAFRLLQYSLLGQRWLSPPKQKGGASSAPPPPPPAPPPRVNIAAPTPEVGVLPPQALPVWLADPAMLTDALSIIRALKPLLQKVVAGNGKRLDVAATVDNIARRRLFLPILKPEKEPWFDIVLVVDRGSSMHIWQRLVKDVVRILRCYGAFRDVQVFDLQVNQTARSPKNAVQLISKPHRPGHRPSELIDQRGRRIVIVLSDCAGKYWWDGTLLPMLQEWGKIMPTVVWQMLPAWMWKRTALGRGTAVAISNDIPGVANQRLKMRIQELEEPEDEEQCIPIPVVTSEVRHLARWSLMVAGDRRAVMPGFLLPQFGGSVPRAKSIEAIARERVQQSTDQEGQADPETAFKQALETIARERVERFLELASPQAQRLVMLLAAAPVITLPVVRLIQDAMLYEAQSSLPVAEVFLSGLLQRLQRKEALAVERVTQADQEPVQAELEKQAQSKSEEDERAEIERDTQDLLQYDFIPQARNILLERLPAVDTIDVINHVSAAVEQRWNRISDQDFRAFLLNPNVEVPEELKGLRSFANVTANILDQLGGQYADFAKELRGEARGPEPSPGPKPTDDRGWKTFEFNVATIVELQTMEVEVATLDKQSYEDVHISRGNNLFDAGDLQGAIAAYNKAIELNPEDAAAYNCRGIAKSELGDYEGAIADYDHAIELNPDNPGAYYNRALTKSELGDKQGAIADYSHAIELNPDNAGAYYNRGLAKSQLGDYEGAIADYDRAIQLNPENAGAYYNRALAKSELGDKQGAIADYSHAIERNPDNAGAYYNRALTKSELGDKQGAIADYNHAIERDPENTGAYCNRGLAKSELGDKQGAIADYSHAIERNPDNAGAYYNRGLARSELGDKQGAIADYDRAIQLNPENAGAYYNLGLAKSQLGDFEGAIADYSHAIELNPENAGAYYNRGLVKAELGDKSAAMSDFSRSLDLQPDQPMVQERIDRIRYELNQHSGLPPTEESDEFLA